MKYTERPFEGKVFYISKNFEKENLKGKDFKVKNAHTLATSVCSFFWLLSNSLILFNSWEKALLYQKEAARWTSH